jgi:nesprin-1
MKEHSNLEELVARYKSLVPTIEMTIVKSDVYSKCYNYRREAKEVGIQPMRRIKI